MFDLPPYSSLRRPGDRSRAGVLFLLLLTLILFFAGPSNAATPLPRLVIGPEEVVLVGQVGQSYQFSASWIGTPPGSPALVWSSSNPDQVKVSSTGLATAVVPNAFAVISVTTLNDIAHHPGYASFGIGAYRSNLIRLTKLWLKKTTTHPASPLSRNFHLEYLVTNNFATRSLTTGQVVFFGNRHGIRLTYPAQVVSGGVLLLGEPPSVNEVYQELHISIDGAAMNRMGAPELKAAQALAANNLEEEDQLCSFGASISLAEDSAFELDLTGGQLQNLALVVSGAAAAGIEPRQISANVSCEKDWNVLPLGMPIPLAGLTLQAWAHATIGASISVSAPFPELTSPAATVTLPFRAGIVLENGELQSVGEPSEPSFDYQLNSVTQGDGKSGITVEAALSGSVGARFSFYPLGLSMYDDLAIVHLDMATFELELARQFELPWAAFQTPFSPGYVGPTIEDSATLSFTLISIETGGTINFFLNLLGVDGITLTPPLPFPPLFEKIYSHPQPQISVASPHVYASGGLPSSTAVVAELPEWTHPILPNPINRVEVWRHHEDDFLAAPWAIGLRHTYTANANELGSWNFRAYAFNNSLGSLRDLFPMASPPAGLEVIGTPPPLTVEPARIDLHATLGSNAYEVLTFKNTGTQAVVYELASLVSNPLLTVDAGGPHTLQPGASRQHAFTLQCGSTPQNYQGRGFALEIGDRVDRFPAKLDCSLLRFSPPRLQFSMDVGQSQSLEVAVSQPLTQSIGYSVIQGGGLDIDPAAGQIHPNQSQILTVTTGCSAAGTFTRIAHFGIDETNFQQSLEAKVICKESGGDTWGDPHLSTFDQVAYDFQAKGEFVLARSESAHFEVQVRQQPMAGRPVTLNTAAAVQLGDHVVAFYTDPAPGPSLTLDGVGTEVPANTTLTLADGGTLERVVGGDRDQYILRPAVGTSYVRIRRNADHLNVFVHPDPAIPDWQGLLGSPDGTPQNDFRLRNGIQLSSPPSFTELYDCNQLACFAYHAPHGWLIRDHAESLFLYPPGQGPLDFAPAPGENYPPEPVTPADYPANQVDAAKEICATAGIHVPALLAACTLDILVTGDVELATAAADVQQGVTLPPPDPTAIQIDASSEYQLGWADKTLDGYFGDCNVGEWATAGQPTGWISFTFPEPIELTRMKLWDRACDEQVLAGQVRFSSNGQTDDLPPVNFGALENGGDVATELLFSPRTVRRVTVHLLQTYRPDGHPNPGLAEVSFNEP